MAIDKNTTWEQLLPQGMSTDTLYVWGAALLVFAATIIVGRSMVEKNPTHGKAKELIERRAELKGEYLSSKRRKRKGNPDKNLALMQIVVNKLNLIQVNKRKQTQQSLVSAGYRSKHALIKYAFAQAALAFGFLIFAAINIKIDLSNPTNALMNASIPFIAFCAGLYLPPILVVNQRTKRMLEIQKGLPDALDLMMICTEAGLTLTAAIDRVSKELGPAYPTLAEELAITATEIGFLPDRKKALENLAERIPLPEIKALTGILIQTEKYGTPISQALRILAKEFRTQRMLRAETKAARLPPMMTVPMIVFILPTLFIVVITPAVIGIMDN
jgi:tight adherence protein C